MNRYAANTQQHHIRFESIEVHGFVKAKINTRGPVPLFQGGGDFRGRHAREDTVLHFKDSDLLAGLSRCCSDFQSDEACADDGDGLSLGQRFAQSIRVVAGLESEGLIRRGVPPVAMTSLL